MTRLLGVNRPPIQEIPLLNTPEKWRDLVTGMIIKCLREDWRYANATVQHTSCEQGTLSEKVYAELPGVLHASCYVVYTIVQLDPRDLPPLYLLVRTGTITRALYAFDMGNLETLVKENVRQYLEMREEALKEAGPEAVARSRRLTT